MTPSLPHIRTVFLEQVILLHVWILSRHFLRGTWGAGVREVLEKAITLVICWYLVRGKPQVIFSSSQLHRMSYAWSTLEHLLA